MSLAVVTGAGSGIGRATAELFVAEGYDVAICDLDQARIDSLAKELGARCKLARRVDVSDREQMRAFAGEVHAIQRGVDVIVNNAGVAFAGTFLETSLDDWDWVLGVNLKGVVHGCHFFAPAMVERGRGQVINISSILGIFPSPNVSAYVASKFAVLGMSRSMRTELAGTGVGVTAICPGLIATQIVADARMAGGAAKRRDSIVSTFTKGLDPHKVAKQIVDAVRTNPAVRTVGKDAWVMHRLERSAPRVIDRLSKIIANRMH